MGISLAMYSVSDSNLAKIKADPALVWRLIEPEDEERYLRSIGVGVKPGFLQRLFGARETPRPAIVPTLELADGEGREEDVDKAWQGIHYCINQSAYKADPPLDFITFGGKELKDIEVGYGAPRYFNSRDTADILKSLGEVSEATIRGNYNPEEMMRLDIYPNIWRENADDGLEYVLENYARLHDFVSHCTGHNLGMVFCLI